MNYYLSQIIEVSFNFSPPSLMACEGQILPISMNTALFSLLGTVYGGNGRTTFGLPDLRGKASNKNMRYCICVEGVYPAKS